VAVFSVQTNVALTEEDFFGLVAEEWRVIRARPSPSSEARAALLALDPKELYAIRAEANEMGFALTGATFAVVLKAVATYAPGVAAKFGDALVAAAARELFLEVMTRIRQKRGNDFAKESEKPSGASVQQGPGSGT